MANFAAEQSESFCSLWCKMLIEGKPILIAMSSEWDLSQRCASRRDKDREPEMTGFLFLCQTYAFYCDALIQINKPGSSNFSLEINHHSITQSGFSIWRLQFKLFFSRHSTKVEKILSKAKMKLLHLVFLVCFVAMALFSAGVEAGVIQLFKYF